MDNLTARRLLTKLVTLVTLITCTLMLTRGVNPADYAAALGRQTTAPLVSVKSQPDSPLRLTVLNNDLSDPKSAWVLLHVSNTDTKAVRAYTISQETTRGAAKSGGYVLADMEFTSQNLQPGQYSTEAVTYQALPDAPDQISLAVDFVEFTDGTTWGLDTEKSSEMLAGRRVGAREAAKRLLKLYKEGGIHAIVKILGENFGDAPAPNGHSSQWVQGFDYGQRFIPQRLKRALDKGGEKQVEKELLKLSEKLAGGK